MQPILLSFQFSVRMFISFKGLWGPFADDSTFFLDAHSFVFYSLSYIFNLLFKNFGEHITEKL